MTAVALVTAAPMNAKNAMVPGKPTACPMPWSRWLRANREKSGIESAMVPQNATADVRPAPKTDQTPDRTAELTAELAAELTAGVGLASIAPQPPART